MGMPKEKRKPLRLSVVLSFLFTGLIMIAIFITDQVQRIVMFGIYALAVVIIYALYVFKMRDIISYVAT